LVTFCNRRRPHDKGNLRSQKDVVFQGSLQVGSGGGFGGLVMPVGVYVVKGDQVRRVPAVDVTVVVGSNLADSSANLGSFSRQSELLAAHGTGSSGLSRSSTGMMRRPGAITYARTGHRSLMFW